MTTVRRLLVVLAAATGLCAAVTVPALAGPLRPPTGVTARAVSDTQVTVSWNAVIAATGYQVFRGTHAGGPYLLVTTTSALSHTDGGLAPATTYYYVVRSKSGRKVSQNSAEVAVTTLFTPPTNVRAIADLDRVDLGWNAVPGVLRYDVVRSGTDGTGVVVVGSTTETAYADTTVAPATGYVYRIRAVAPGISSDSAPVSVFTGRRTTTALSVSPSPSEERQYVLLTATVRPADATVTRYTGEVVFYADDTWLGAAWVEDGRGVAEVQRLVPGGSLRAEYRGDSSVPLGSSSSEPVPHVVQAPANAPVSFGPFRVHRYGLDSWPMAAAVADVTGDGRADALMTTQSHGVGSDEDFRLWVFAQQADGSLAAPRVLATHGAPAATMRVATGDVDGDADADVAVTVREGVDLFLQADGGLADPILIPVQGGGSDLLSGDVRLADIDRDGRDDLVVAGVQLVMLYRSGPGGTFGDPVVVETAARQQVEVGDVTGDGRPDVVTRDRYRTVFVHAQTQDGGFVERWRQAVPTGYMPLVNAVAVGDITGEGQADLVAAVDGNVPGSRLQVYAQTAAGDLADPVTYAAYNIPEPLALADLNGDGRRDVTTVHGGWQTFSVMLQRPDGRLGADYFYDLPYATHYNPRGLAVGDVTGDGRPDVVVADYNYGLVVVPQT
jgi:hypothetical protein